MKRIDLTGKRFGRLVVTRREGTLSNGGKASLRAWLCQCDCGGTVVVRGSCLVSGNTLSCGCLGKEILSNRVTTHGKSKTPLYGIWVGIKTRCNPASKSTRRKRFYSSRNISLCPEWQRFEPFYEWAKDKWVAGLDIDRIDTTKGYSPDNCQFITRKRNTQNTRRSRLWFLFGGRFKSSNDAAKRLGVSQSHIHALCCGVTKNGKYYPPEQLCYTEELYASDGQH